MAAIAAETSSSDNDGLEALAATMAELLASVSDAIFNLADQQGDVSR